MLRYEIDGGKFLARVGVVGLVGLGVLAAAVYLTHGAAPLPNFPIPKPSPVPGPDAHPALNSLLLAGTAGIRRVLRQA